MIDIQEQISYLYRSGSSVEDVECADTMEAMLEVVEATKVVIKCAFPTLDYKDDQEGVLALMELAGALAKLEEQNQGENDE